MAQILKNAAKKLLPVGTYERFRARMWRYVRPAFVDYCPLRLPWMLRGHATSDAARVRRRAFDFHWNDRWSLVTTIAILYAAVCWPVRTFFVALREVSRYGGYVSRCNGKSRSRQLWEILCVAVLHNVPVGSYYRLRIYALEDLRQSADFIYSDEMSVLHPLLMRKVRMQVNLGNKHEFLEAAVSAGIPVPKTFAYFGQDGVRWPGDTPGELPGMDLVVKPVDLACGCGVEVWTHETASNTWAYAGRQLDAGALIAHCDQLARGRGHILQERLFNHPTIERLAGRGLCTVRVITYLMNRTDAEPEILLACLRMHSGRSYVDNFAAGGIAAPIDSTSGRIGRAVAKDPRRGSFAIHPDTHTTIVGAEVPYWPQVQALARRAQQTFRWMPTIGWDVALTANGPVVLEANPNWCTDLAQVVWGVPVGQTPYAAFYLSHVEGESDPQPVPAWVMAGSCR